MIALVIVLESNLMKEVFVMHKVFSCLFFSFLFLLFIGIIETKDADGKEKHGKLPKDVIPIHYDISIFPDIETSILNGNETIEIDIKKATNVIMINSHELNITYARLKGIDVLKNTSVSDAVKTKNASLSDPKVKLNPKEQTAILLFPMEIQPGRYKLEINYTGKLDIKPHGLFMAWQEGSTGRKPLLATQFEAIDARRMFPCWDEPSFKATFNLSAKIPKEFLAISNTSITSEEDIKSDGKVNNKLKYVKFSTTPKMSTYLLVFVAGGLEFISGAADGVTIRIVTPPGKKEKGRYALSVAKKLLPFYNQYFGIKYPLPKLDLITVSGGFGAMENWGGITFSEDLLLFDPKSSSLDTKRNIFEIIAHEMAHQWFGNIITMAWWNDLWLNEGLASWMEIKTTDHFNPQWESWLRFTSEADRAIETDSRRTTFPIERTVLDDSQADQAFDEISYVKAASVIRMLENYLGEDLFQKGIRYYMQSYKYANTASKDFWHALQDVSGQPIEEIAKEWTKQPGLPIVKLSSSCKEGINQITVSQKKFTYFPIGEDEAKEKETIWKIPICFFTDKGNNQGSNGCNWFLLTGREEIIKGNGCSEPALIKDRGYFRVKYEDSIYGKIKKGNLTYLSLSDKILLLSDTWALAKKGGLPIKNYLDLVDSFTDNLKKDNLSYPLWKQILGAFNTIDTLAIGKPERNDIRIQFCSWLLPVFKRVGWEKKPNEDENTTQFRISIISALGKFGNKEIINEAFNCFERFKINKSALPAYIRPAVLSIVGLYAQEETFKMLHELGRKSMDVEEKLLFYNAMLSNLNAERAKQGLSVALTDELDPVNAVYSVHTVAFSGEHPELALEFTKKHAVEIFAKLSSIHADTYIPKLFEAFTDKKWALELKNYAKANLPAGAAPQVAKACEKISFHAELKKRLLPALKTWIVARKAK